MLLMLSANSSFLIFFVETGNICLRILRLIHCFPSRPFRVFTLSRNQCNVCYSYLSGEYLLLVKSSLQVKVINLFTRFLILLSVFLVLLLRYFDLS